MAALGDVLGVGVVGSLQAAATIATVAKIVGAGRFRCMAVFAPMRVWRACNAHNVCEVGQLR